MNPLLIDPLLTAALHEDLGLAGDLTSQALFAPATRGRAALVARKPGRVAGLFAALPAFAKLDPSASCTIAVADGTDVAAGQTIATVEASVQALLGAERVALNLLCHLAGIATLTAQMVAAVAGTRARIVCTRKTLPGLRAVQKEAVRLGGGQNHRFGLFDAVMLKDNHLAAAGGIEAAVARVRAHIGHLVKIELEVDRLEQIAPALAAGVDAILLDNMDPATLAEGVRLVAGRAVTEASGGVTLESVRQIAATGVDLISSGALTHSAKVLDIGLDWL